MPQRKHFAFRSGGRVYINHMGYVALRQEVERLQAKKNKDRDELVLRLHAEEQLREVRRRRDLQQIATLTRFLQEHGVQDAQTLMRPTAPPPGPEIPPVINLLRDLPKGFRKGIPLLIERIKEAGWSPLPIAIFHSRKHARYGKSKLRAVARFGGTEVKRKFKFPVAGTPVDAIRRPHRQRLAVPAPPQAANPLGDDELINVMPDQHLAQGQAYINAHLYELQQQLAITTDRLLQEETPVQPPQTATGRVTYTGTFTYDPMLWVGENR